MSTTSTDGMLQTARARLMAYTAPDASTKLTSLGNARVFLRRAPADGPFPLVVLTKENTTVHPEFAGYREDFELVAEVRGRGLDTSEVVDDIADLVTQAFLSWADSSVETGFTMTNSLRREPLPDDGIDIGVRVIAECFAYPRVLTDALT